MLALLIISHCVVVQFRLKYEHNIFLVVTAIAIVIGLAVVQLFCMAVLLSALRLMRRELEQRFNSSQTTQINLHLIMLAFIFVGFSIGYGGTVVVIIRLDRGDDEWDRINRITGAIEFGCVTIALLLLLGFYWKYAIIPVAEQQSETQVEVSV